MSHSHHHHDNPFFNRQRISDPAYFYGRAQSVENLYSAIATRQSRSLVGERKIGKSSLLTFISCPGTLRQHGFDPAQFVFIYMDLEGMANIGYDEFWPELLDQMALSLPTDQAELRAQAETLSLQTDTRFMQVRRLLRRVERAGLRVVLMLDEFESLATNAAFDASFYGELRSLAGELGVTYITTSKRGLYDLTYQYADTLSSPFFNIFSEERLNLLPREEAVELLRGLSGKGEHHPFTEKEIEFCLEHAGRHPFFVQVIACHLFAARTEPIPDAEVEALVLRRFLAEAEDHYRYLWRQLDEAEQAGLRHLHTANTDTRRALQEKALVELTDEGRLRPFSRSFSEFAQRAEIERRPSTNPRTTTSTTDLTGATLGSYRVLSTLGRGGMAVVYKGYQPSLDRYVAIKVMSRSLGGAESFVERFQREAAGVAQLRHQNIVQMVDFGVQDDISYMVMEYIQGESLKDWLRQLREVDHRLPLTDAVKVVRDIAAALDYAHAHGIVHRDVKPANIMLRQEERLAQLTGNAEYTAVLTDFGVARMLEGAQLTGTGATIGTPDYMSPEQAHGRPAQAASDIYALGIVLFEMLTGELPFTADTPVALLLQHMQATPPPLTVKAPDIPPDLELVLMQSLAKDPENRYATAGQFAAALQRGAKIFNGQ
ncbi:MAG TPA: protein kinase [Chloroflexota bacterium]|nr:protein kinase [Chloroflexota bacterium]